MGVEGQWGEKNGVLQCGSIATSPNASFNISLAKDALRLTFTGGLEVEVEKTYEQLRLQA